MRRWAILAFFVFAFVSPVFSQYYPYSNQVIINSHGLQAGAFAQVTVCVQAGCPSEATIYGNSSGSGGPIANPLSADQNGNFTFWSAAGIYQLSIQSSVSATAYLSYITVGIPSAAGTTGQIQLNDSGVLAGGAQSSTLAIKPLTADSLQYVSLDPNASDSNDGLSWGTAVKDITTAYNNLPGCENSEWYYYPSYSSVAWTHCGIIKLAAGAYSLSGVTIESPEVAIIGSGPQNTTLSCTTTASNWCLGYSIGISNDPIDTNGSMGVYNLTIDGYNASAGAYGLYTNDISSLQIQNVQIQNFSGSGSVCWYDTATESYNEKRNVNARFNNCTIGHQIHPQSTAPGYPSTTFGYGTFEEYFRTWPGQTAFQMDDGILSESIIDFTINCSVQNFVAGIRLNNNAELQSDVGLIHIEAPAGVGTGNEIYVAGSATFNGNIWVDQDFASSNVNFSTNYYYITSNPTFRYAPQIANNQYLSWLDDSSVSTSIMGLGTDNTVYFTGHPTAQLMSFQPDPGTNTLQLTHTGAIINIQPSDGTIPACYDASSYLSTGCGPQVTSVAYSATPTLTFSNNAQIQEFKCTTAGASITPTFTGLSAGLKPIVIFVQNGTTACTFTWPSNVHNAPTVTTTLNGVTTALFVVSGNGTDMYNLGSNSCTSSCGTP